MKPPVKSSLCAFLLLWGVVALTNVSCDAQPAQAPTQTAPALTKRYLYVGRAPKERDGFRTLKPSLEVYDIDNGHKLVKVIPLPATVMNIRGIMANAPTRKL